MSKCRCPPSSRKCFYRHSVTCNKKERYKFIIEPLLISKRTGDIEEINKFIIGPQKSLQLNILPNYTVHFKSWPLR